MPNFLAHSLVAKRVMAKEGKNDSGFLASDTEDFFILGSFGPDALFYGGLLPQNGLHLGYARKKIGNKIHKTDAKDYFRLLVNEVYSTDDVKSRRQFEAFTLGQLSHYLLDSIAHPYIRYESGFDSNGRITGKFHYEPAHFESRIDAALGKKYGISYYLEPDHFPVCSKKKVLNCLEKPYDDVLKSRLKLKRLPKHYYSSCIKNWISIYKLSNKKGKFFTFLYGKSQLGAIRTPKDVDRSVLNEEKQDWKNPVTGEIHNESFIQRHAKATELTCACYKDLRKQGFNYSVISKYLDGLDYYGKAIGSKMTIWKGKKATD